MISWKVGLDPASGCLQHEMLWYMIYGGQKNVLYTQYSDHYRMRTEINSTMGKAIGSHQICYARTCTVCYSIEIHYYNFEVNQISNLIDYFFFFFAYKSTHTYIDIKTYPAYLHIIYRQLITYSLDYWKQLVVCESTKVLIVGMLGLI